MEMIDEYDWPEGFHKHQDFRLNGPEAKPGNMQKLVELIEALHTEIIGQSQKIVELENRVVELELKSNET